METGSNSNNEGRITRNHDAFLRSLRNPQIGDESQLALLRIFIAGLPRAPMDEPPADESDQKCAVCRESLWPSGETEPSEVALQLECCSRFIGENCLKIWLSPHSEGGGGGHTCPFCRKQFIDRWPLIEHTPPVPREWMAAGSPTRESEALWRDIQTLVDERGQPLFHDELLDAPRGRHNIDGVYQPFYDGEPPARTHHGHNDDSLRNPQDLENRLLEATARLGRIEDELFLEARAYASMREDIQTVEAGLQSARQDLESISERLRPVQAGLQSAREDLESISERHQTVETDLQSAREDLESIHERHQPVQEGTSLTATHHDGDGELANDGEPLGLIVLLLTLAWFYFLAYTTRE